MKNEGVKNADTKNIPLGMYRSVKE